MTPLKLALVLALFIGLPNLLNAQDDIYLPDDIVISELSATEIKDAETCVAELNEFSWICQEFDHSGWEYVYGDTFWERGELVVYRYDIDSDGTIDAIVKLQHSGFCGRGGPNCSHLFLFGDQPASEHPYIGGLPQQTDGPPSLIVRNGETGLIFPKAQYRLPPPPGFYFFPIGEIREKILSSQQVTLEIRMEK